MNEPETPSAHPKMWIAVAVVFLAAVAFVFFENDSFYRDFESYFSANTPPQVSPARSEHKPAIITIDFGNGKKRSFQGEAQTGMTIVSALHVIEEIGNFNVATNERGEVVTIDGLTNDGRQWHVYVNNTPASNLPGHIELKPGDRIAFKYE